MGSEADMSQYGQIFSYEAMNAVLFLRQHFSLQGNASSSTPPIINKAVNMGAFLFDFFVFYDIFVENK